MKVSELLGSLKTSVPVEFREDDLYLCKTMSNNKIACLFSDREVIEWYPTKVDSLLVPNVGLAVNIKGADTE